MKIIVLGGTGLIGSKIVPILRQRDHEVVTASPKTGVHSITGEGLRPKSSRCGGRGGRSAPYRGLDRRNGSVPRQWLFPRQGSLQAVVADAERSGSGESGT